MTHAYDESYLDDAMEILGEMFSVAVDKIGYDADEFYLWFIHSKLAEEFGRGNPKFVAGMSGIELAAEVVYRVKGERDIPEIKMDEDKSPAYWAGWILAYYQWYTGRSFKKLYQNGLTMQKILSMYILHEADESKFVEWADAFLDRNKKDTHLHAIRKARGYTQKQLSEKSGVKLRMIQLYEQRKNNINNAAVSTVESLAIVLGCQIEDLME